MKRMLGIGLLLFGAACLASLDLSVAKEKPKQTLPDLQPLWPGDKDTNPAPGALGNTPADIPGVYVYPAKTPNGTAIVVCPGGGYGGLAMDHEGRQIADWLNRQGITAVV